MRKTVFLVSTLLLSALIFPVAKPKIVKKTIPVLSEYTKTELLCLNYQEMIPVLTKGMQEQQEQIEALKKEVAELKSLIVPQQTFAGKKTETACAKYSGKIIKSSSTARFVPCDIVCARLVRADFGK